MKRYYIDAPEATHILELSEGETYEIFRELNRELKAQDYITVSGRIPRALSNKKFFDDLEEMAG